MSDGENSFSELKETLKQYGHVFICPYSVAHLRDLLTNFEANRKEYEKDLNEFVNFLNSNAAEGYEETERKVQRKADEI